jgi:hypothetical protein
MKYLPKKNNQQKNIWNEFWLLDEEVLGSSFRTNKVRISKTVSSF